MNYSLVSNDLKIKGLKGIHGSPGSGKLAYLRYQQVIAHASYQVVLGLIAQRYFLKAFYAFRKYSLTRFGIRQEDSTSEDCCQAPFIFSEPCLEEVSSVKQAPGTEAPLFLNHPMRQVSRRFVSKITKRVFTGVDLNFR
jgi:hypothetical protein